MGTLTVTGIVIFIVLLFFMSMTAGTQSSMSQLAGKWRWILLVALWSQVMLLPQMIEMALPNWRWIPFFGVAGIVICGGANVLDKTDELVHVIGAIVAFIAFVAWVLMCNWICIIPLIICLAAGKENIKWRCEVGLITSVYMAMLLTIV